MNLQFEEVMIMVGALALVVVILLLMRDKQLTGDKLQKSYPPETAKLISDLVGAVVTMTAKTSNKVDDQAAVMFTTWLKAQGIEIPTVSQASPKVGEGETKVKAPDIA